jgi:hypothetical protein
MSTVKLRFSFEATIPCLHFELSKAVYIWLISFKMDIFTLFTILASLPRTIEWMQGRQLLARRKVCPK